MMYAFALVHSWNNLHVIVKVGLIVVGYFVKPTVAILENLFMSYDTYKKEGLW